MVRIFNSDSAPVAKLKWDIFKGASGVQEDFHDARLLFWFVSGLYKYRVEVAIHDNSIECELPRFLPPGVYGVKALWCKDWFKRSKSEVEKVFAITDVEGDATPVDGASFTIHIKSYVASYGYDGLSAYELALLKGVTTAATEEEWLAEVGNRAIDLAGTFNYSRYMQNKTSADEPVACSIRDLMADMPSFLRSGGKVVTFIKPDGSWEVWQFKAKNVAGWNDISNWECLYYTGLNSSFQQRLTNAESMIGELRDDYNNIIPITTGEIDIIIHK